MIKNKKYIGDIAKTDVRKIIKELKATGNHDNQRIELMTGESNDYWWYYLYIYNGLLLWDDIEILSKYKKCSISYYRDGLHIGL